jgi:hypothetical protein
LSPSCSWTLSCFAPPSVWETKFHIHRHTISSVNKGHPDLRERLKCLFERLKYLLVGLMLNYHTYFIQNQNWHTSKAYFLWAPRTQTLSFPPLHDPSLVWNPNYK